MTESELQSHRRLRRVAFVAFIAIGASLFTASLLPAPAAADLGDSVWAEAEKCASLYGGLQVQFVVDISSSLVTTDPNFQREALLKVWLDRLFAQSSTSEIRVSIGEYGTQWIEALPWSTLDSKAYETANFVVNTLAKDQEDTDHVLAMLEASRSLDHETQRITSIGRTPCRLLLWFTDGGYDFGSKSAQFRKDHGLDPRTVYSNLKVSDKNESAIKAAGEAFMCGPGGSVDQMRLQNTGIVVVALDTGGGDFRLVNEVATGDGFPDGDPGPGCRLPHYEFGGFELFPPGTPATPPASADSTVVTESLPPATPPPTAIESPPSATGSAPTTPAGSVPSATKVPTSTTVLEPQSCVTVSCVADTTIEVPSLADRIQLRVEVLPAKPRPNAPSAHPDLLQALQLTTPNGQTTSIDPTVENRSVLIGPFDGDVTPLGGTGVLVQTGSTRDRTVAGTWRLRTTFAVPDASVKVTPTFLSGLSPHLLGSPPLTDGGNAKLIFDVTDRNGVPVSGDIARQLTIDAILPVLTARTPQGLVPSDDGHFALAVPEQAIATSSFELNVILTVGSMQPVRFASASLKIPIDRPEYPSVVFPSAKGGAVNPSIFDTPGSVTVEYQVLGPRNGTGCVMPSADRFGATAGAGSGAVATFEIAGKDCVDADGSITRQVKFAVGDRFQGTRCGRLSFALEGSTAATPREFTQNVCLRTERGIDIGTIVLAILLGVAGVTLPFLLLGLLNRYNGRLPAAPPARAATTTVQLTDDGCKRAGGGTLLDADDFTFANFAGGPGSRTLPGGHGIRLERRTMSVPRGSGSSWPFPILLLIGPGTFLRTPNPTSLIVGCGSEVLHVGLLMSALRVPRRLDGLWVIAPLEATARPTELIEEQDHPLAAMVEDRDADRAAGLLANGIRAELMAVKLGDGYTVQELSRAVIAALDESTIRTFAGAVAGL